jgi:hypothetical protein
MRELLFGLLKDPIHEINDARHPMAYILKNVKLCADHRLAYLSYPFESYNEITKSIIARNHICMTMHYPNPTPPSQIYYNAPPSNTIHYFLDNDEMTKGSIYSLLYHMTLDTERLLLPILMDQLYTTYKKQHPWRSSLEPFIPKYLCNLVIDHWGHREAIEYECTQVELLLLTSVLIRRISAESNRTQTLSEFIYRQMDRFIVNHMVKIIRDPSYSVRLSSLTHKKSIELILQFGRFQDCEKLAMELINQGY